MGLELSNGVIIDDSELDERFVRSSGPGGQNVNKVSTAVALRFDIRNSPSLSDELRARILQRRDRRITSDGVAVISAQRFRLQERNRDDARVRLVSLLNAALAVQPKRVATKPTRGSKERRLTAKKQRGQRKLSRDATNWD